MAKPTLVFVPSAWHGPEIYDSTRAMLDKEGFTTIALPLPSVGADPPKTSFDEDVEAIRNCLKQLIEVEHKDVVLASHSYAGMPANEAPSGLSKAERAAKGFPGGLIRIVFIAALAMSEGFSCTAGGASFPEWMRVDESKGVVNVTREDAKNVFYNDMSENEAEKWASKIRPQSLGVYYSTTTYAAWRDVLSTFLIGTEDKTVFNAEFAQFVITSAQQQVPTAFDVVERCEGAGHCMMISRPEWLAGAMRRASGDGA